jgi:Right handed beta helix region
MKKRLLFARLAILLAAATIGAALWATQAFARSPSPAVGTVNSSATDPANATIYLTQLFAPGEVNLSTLGVSPTDLFGVGPTTSSSDPSGTLIVAPIGSTDCPNAQYHTIQSAVNAAPAGAMIKVCAGTYIEQVTIPAGKDGLTLYSVPDLQAVIKAPSVMTGRKAIVEVSGAQNVTIRHFTITGPGGPCGNSIRYGVFVGGGGSALITDNHITQIHDTPFCGTQNGLGVAVGRALPPDGPTTGSATVVHNLIDNYQKGGVLVDNAGSSAEVAYNEIEGVGPTPLIAQNGIQASRNASANIHQNTVSNNNYALPGTDSVGILLFMESNGATTVGHNSSSLNDDGIFLFGNVVGTQITNNSSTQNEFTGITADSTTSSNTISYNKASGNGMFDCEDDSTGGGTAGTANFWIKDFGQTENPPGICKQTGP